MGPVLEPFCFSVCENAKLRELPQENGLDGKSGPFGKDAQKETPNWKTGQQNDNAEVEGN